MQLSATSPSQTVLLSGIILIVLGLGGSYLLLLPALQTANGALAQADSQLSADQQNLASLKQVSAQVTKVNQALSSQGVDISKVKQILPATEDLPSLYIQMESLVAKAQATIGSPAYTLGTPATDATTNAVQIPVTVSGNGDYTHLKLFLSSFEQNIRPVTFTQVAFTVAAASASPAPAAPADKAAPLGPVTLSATGFVKALGLSSAYAPATSTP